MTAKTKRDAKTILDLLANGATITYDRMGRMSWLGGKQKVNVVAVDALVDAGLVSKVESLQFAFQGRYEITDRGHKVHALLVSF